MKKLFKTIVALSAASAMMLSTTAMAATTSTVTKYTAEKTTVISKVDGLTENSMVTYLAVQGNDGVVNDDGSNIAYIGQQTVDSTKSATFDYEITGNIGTGTYATVKYGSNVDTISDTDTVAVGNVTVAWVGSTGTVTGDTAVGNNDTTTLNIVAPENYEIINIKVNDTNYDASVAGALVAKAGDTVTVTVAATNATPSVYLLDGATLADAEAVDKVYSKVGIARVVGKIDKLYFTFDGGNYTMNGAVEGGKFYADGIGDNASGYYGVEIEDTVDVSAYTVNAVAVSGTNEYAATIIK